MSIITADDKNVVPAAHVTTGIWIGDSRAARDMDLLGQLDITAIINVSGFDDTPIEDVNIYNYTLYDNDLMENEIDRVKSKINSIVNDLSTARRAKKNVLVHDGRDCVNRAPFIVAYYLVRDLNMNPEEAILSVKRANEARDTSPRETVLYKEDSGLVRKEERCRYVRTLTNRSFCSIIRRAKK